MAFALLLAATPARARQQHEGTGVEGVVRDAESGAPLVGAWVRLVDQPRSEITHDDGTFHLHRVPPGSHEMRVERIGYRPWVRTVIVVEGEYLEVEIELQASALAIQGLVVTGMISERSSADAVQSVDVLAGDELQLRLSGTVARTLASQPGITETSMGPAAARPVIRGLGGDRVLLLEDGVRVGDVSGTSPDHATALDPASARRIEVVRGPASILYGSSALGGVINVIRDEVPSEVPHHATGSATLQGTTVDDGVTVSASGQLALGEHLPLRLELGGRTAGDLATPTGPLINTSVDNWNGSVGTSWVDDWGYAGAAVRLYRNDYGIPGGFLGGHENGVGIEMERNSVKSRLRYEPSSGPFRSIVVDGVYTWYQHREIEPPDIVATVFQRETWNADVLARHGAWGPFTSGAFGVRGASEDFVFGGALGTPDSDRRSLAAFGFQEIDLGDVRFEAGLRYDWTETSPEREDPDSDIGFVRSRTFGAASGSLGVVWTPTEVLALGANLARAFRTPDVNELYSEGPHLAAYAFEVGNPSLESEIGTGIDVFARVGTEALNAELTVFTNRISGYVFPEETGDTSRVRLPIFQFQGENAEFVGWEGGFDWAVAGDFKLEAGASYVRASLRDSGDPLPLIPPLQGNAALAWQPTGGFVRVETRWADAQDRLGRFETRTDGYTVFNLAAGLRLSFGGRLHVITASIENLTDTEYRNHLSRVKSIMPEAGRGLSLTYRVVF